MRKLIAVALVLAMTSLGAPVGALAQTSTAALLGGVSGEALDAGGRALVGQRVELVQAGQVIQTTTTGSRGEWTFANVPAGDYVVRIALNGRVAGIRVSVTPGQVLAGQQIVAASAGAASPAFLAGLGLLWGTVFAVVVAAAVVTTVVVVTGS